MPDIDSIGAAQYQPNQPYHVFYDNIPLQQLNAKIAAVNSLVDTHDEVLRLAQGTQGSLSARLDQSLNQDGSLSSIEVDETLHHVAFHSDGNVTVSPSILGTITALGYNVTNPVGYVRMLAVERSKLSSLAPGATSLSAQFPGVTVTSAPISFSNTTVVFQNSNSVTWQVQAPNIILAHTILSPSAVVQHVYDANPSPQTNPSDYTTYYANSLQTPFVSGSLRVFVNGIRLSHSGSVHVPAVTFTTLTFSTVSGSTTSVQAGTVPTSWRTLQFTAVESTGTFTLSQAITQNDVIRIDYDTAVG